MSTNLWGRGFLSWICLRCFFTLCHGKSPLEPPFGRTFCLLLQGWIKQIQAYEVPQLPITNWDEYWSHLQFSLCLFLLKATCIGICIKISVKWKKEGALAYWRMDIFQLFLLLIGRLWLKPALESWRQFPPSFLCLQRGRDRGQLGWYWCGYRWYRRMAKKKIWVWVGQGSRRGLWFIQNGSKRMFTTAKVNSSPPKIYRVRKGSRIVFQPLFLRGELLNFASVFDA